MPWFKVDDQLHTHPKWLAASPAAKALWVTAGSWCATHLTDGLVPRHVLPVLGGSTKTATELVAVGLWHEDGKGWRFHAWLEFQPSAEQVSAERASARERQRVARSPELRESVRVRDEDCCRYCGEKVRWTDRRGRLGGTYDHVIPSGPSTEANLVVACRGCNASKGRRTPQEAGMALLPIPRSKSDLGPDLAPDLDTSRPPTRPDPTVRDNPPTPRKRRSRKPAEPPNPSSQIPKVEDVIANQPPMDPDGLAHVQAIRSQLKGATGAGAVVVQFGGPRTSGEAS